jgi:hypothetical protein
MEPLLEAIRAAVATDATAEQKTAGAQACRTIFTALEAETGKPIGLPSAPKAHPLAGLTFDQALELVIMRLTSVAEARDTKAQVADAPKPPVDTPKLSAVAAPRIPLIQPSLGARTTRRPMPPNQGTSRVRAR